MNWVQLFVLSFNQIVVTKYITLSISIYHYSNNVLGSPIWVVNENIDQVFGEGKSCYSSTHSLVFFQVSVIYRLTIVQIWKVNYTSENILGEVRPKE